MPIQSIIGGNKYISKCGLGAEFAVTEQGVERPTVQQYNNNNNNNDRLTAFDPGQPG